MRQGDRCTDILTNILILPLLVVDNPRGSHPVGRDQPEARKIRRLQSHPKERTGIVIVEVIVIVTVKALVRVSVVVILIVYTWTKLEKERQKERERER